MSKQARTYWLPATLGGLLQTDRLALPKLSIWHPPSNENTLGVLNYTNFSGALTGITDK